MREDYEALRKKIQHEPIVVPFDHMCARIDSLNNNVKREYLCVLVLETTGPEYSKGNIVHVPQGLVIDSKLQSSLLEPDPIAEHIRRQSRGLDEDFEVYTLRVINRNWASGVMTAVSFDNCAFIMTPSGLMLADFLVEALNKRQILAYQRFLNEILMASNAYSRI